MKGAPEILKAFAGSKEEGGHFGKFGRHNGYLYTTNGHICIRIDDDESVLVDADFSFAEKIQSLLETATPKPVEICLAALIQLPEAIPCSICNGTGCVEDHLACDGMGCQGCDCGTVASKPEINGHYECWACEGSTESLHNPVHVGNTYFNRRYLHLLQQLEGTVLLLAEMPLGPHFFRFKGGMGAIMPTNI